MNPGFHLAPVDLSRPPAGWLSRRRCASPTPAWTSPPPPPYWPAWPPPSRPAVTLF